MVGVWNEIFTKRSPRDTSRCRAAESNIKWLKARARLLLSQAGMDVKFWPNAMRQACALYIARQRQLPCVPIVFGANVMVKVKKQTLGPFERRWQSGTLMGPAVDVREGHVIRLENGHWLRTTSVKQVEKDEP